MSGAMSGYSRRTMYARPDWRDAKAHLAMVRPLELQASRVVTVLHPCARRIRGLSGLVHAHIARDRVGGFGPVAPAETRFDFWGSMADLGRLVLRSGAPQ